MAFINPEISQETRERITALEKGVRGLSLQWNGGTDDQGKQIEPLPDEVKRTLREAYAYGMGEKNWQDVINANPRESIAQSFAKSGWEAGGGRYETAQAHARQLGARTACWQEYLGPDLDTAAKAQKNNSIFAADFVEEMRNLRMLREWMRAVAPHLAMPEKAPPQSASAPVKEALEPAA